MLIKPNMLLVAGQQQNVGKTTFACNVISEFSNKYAITAIKVTPHFHKSTGKANLSINKKGYQIFQETSVDSNKDTSRMLKAGAMQSWLLQAEPTFLLQGLQEFLSMIPENHMVVCESAGVREHLIPGMFLALKLPGNIELSTGDENMFRLADRIVTFYGKNFDFSPDELTIENGRWNIRK
jgi:hypothetical protein